MTKEEVLKRRQLRNVSTGRGGTASLGGGRGGSSAVLSKGRPGPC